MITRFTDEAAVVDFLAEFDGEVALALAAAGTADARWWLIFQSEEGPWAISYPQEDDEPDDAAGVIHGPMCDAFALPLPLQIVWHDGIDAEDLDVFEPPHPDVILEVLERHRLESDGPLSGRCVCGDICYGGGGLSGTPGLDAYREHLAAAICDQLEPWTQQTSTRKLGEVLEAVLKARTTPTLTAGPRQVARWVAAELRRTSQTGSVRRTDALIVAAVALLVWGVLTVAIRLPDVLDPLWIWLRVLSEALW